ncbi:PP2C family protein-serine/threonine phosphatase [Streptomyces sp. NPDC102340]|uniref:PP2C family protein-serine/threonine phosphatase n=1 Tax=unclassified Streptomyces TaxID=2593676 RepID=UPI0038200073
MAEQDMGRGGRSRPAEVIPLLGSGVLAAGPGLLVPGWPPMIAPLLIVPLLAALRLDARCTAVAAVLAMVLALTVTVARDLILTPRAAVECLALLVGGALTVRLAMRDAVRATALSHATEIARVAEAAILRPVDARVGGIAVCTRHHCRVPGTTVGGDLYDVVHTPYGTRLFIGDVRGHGLDAVRITASALSGFRDLAYVTPELPDLVRELDARLAPYLGAEDFVTAVFAEFGPSEVKSVNCGHPPPLRLGSPPKLLEPHAACRPLGLGPEPEQSKYWLQPGDRLLFYTDGLSEARDRQGVEFPLEEAAADAASSTVRPDDFLDSLYEAVTTHTGGPLRDDVALILCEDVGSAGGRFSPAAAPYPSQRRPMLPRR